MKDKVYSVPEIKQKITPILKKSKVRRAVLFGSYAKGNPTPASDIDIYIDSEGVLNGFNFFAVYEVVEKKLKKKIDLIEAMDVKKDSKIYNEIVNHGVIIYE
ncbi:MAG: nucleotidyltransferase domain-containing protein [Oscillospiraceae bacterium]|nr:nucleotidyltransferase domain-containing protein [Oscillospiraceae bacterium]